MMTQKGYASEKGYALCFLSIFIHPKIQIQNISYMIIVPFLAYANIRFTEEGLMAETNSSVKKT